MPAGQLQAHKAPAHPGMQSRSAAQKEKQDLKQAQRWNRGPSLEKKLSYDLSQWAWATSSCRQQSMSPTQPEGHRHMQAEREPHVSQAAAPSSSARLRWPIPPRILQGS